MGSWVRAGDGTGMLDPMENDPLLEVEEWEMGRLEAISETDSWNKTQNMMLAGHPCLAGQQLPSKEVKCRSAA